jgi:hypothetical protein
MRQRHCQLPAQALAAGTIGRPPWRGPPGQWGPPARAQPPAPLDLPVQPREPSERHSREILAWHTEVGKADYTVALSAAPQGRPFLWTKENERNFASGVDELLPPGVSDRNVWRPPFFDFMAVALVTRAVWRHPFSDAIRLRGARVPEFLELFHGGRVERSRAGRCTTIPAGTAG